MQNVSQVCAKPETEQCDSFAKEPRYLNDRVHSAFNLFGDLSNCVRCGVPGQSFGETIFPGICRHDGTIFCRQLWNQTCIQAQVVTNLACQQTIQELLERERRAYFDCFQLRSVNESTILQRRMLALTVDEPEEELDFHYLEIDGDESQDDEYQDAHANMSAPSNQNAQNLEQ